MTEIKRKINKTHFYILAFVFLNLIIQSISGLGLSSNVVFGLKIIIYISGIVLFFLNIKPFKKRAVYFSFYFLSSIIGLLFWIFGGIFLGLLSSILLFPIYPKDIVYQKNNFVVYSSFTGFLGACCEYEITESKTFVFEKHIGKFKIEGQLEREKSDIKIVKNKIEYRHKIFEYKDGIETEKDTLEILKIE
jgi:hypothetical protein